MFRGVRAKLSAFRSGRRGVVLYLVALLMVPFAALLGVAVDVGQLLTVKNQLSSAIDAAALSIATTPGISQSNALVQAQNFVSANFSAQYPGATLSSLSVTPAQDQGSGNCPANTVCITASATVNTAFVKVLGSQYNTLSTAVSTQVRAPAQSYCMLTLDPAGWSHWGRPAAGVGLWGGVVVTMTGCGIATNATGTQALTLQSGGTLNAPTVSIAGLLNNVWSTVNVASIKQNQRPVADPYANVEMPAATSNVCTTSPYVYSSGSNSDCIDFATTTTPSTSIVVTLNPARYCNGLTISNGVNTKLNPGIYTIKSGTLTMTAVPTNIVGDGVTFALTTREGANSYANVSLSGGVVTTLTAPTAGPAAGILFFGDRNAPTTTVSEFNAFGTLNLTGAIYLPTHLFQYLGGGTITGCNQIIAWDVGDYLNNLPFEFIVHGHRHEAHQRHFRHFGQIDASLPARQRLSAAGG